MANEKGEQSRRPESSKVPQSTKVPSSSKIPSSSKPSTGTKTSTVRPHSETKRQPLPSTVGYSYPPPEYETYAPGSLSMRPETRRESTSTMRGATTTMKTTMKGTVLHVDPTKGPAATERGTFLHVDPTRVSAAITTRGTYLRADDIKDASRYSKLPTQEPTVIKDRLPTIREPSHYPSSRATQEPSIIKPFTQEPTSIKDRPATQIEPSTRPLTILDNTAPSTSRPTIRPEPTKLEVKSFLLTPEDVKMASRQTRIETLPPQERLRQESWAQTQIKMTGPCPEGYEWKRMPGGYQCHGGGHGVTDELLAEGTGGVYVMRTKEWDKKEGPYYPHPTKRGEFWKPGNKGGSTVKGLRDTRDMGSSTR